MLWVPISNYRKFGGYDFCNSLFYLTKNKAPPPKVILFISNTENLAKQSQLYSFGTGRIPMDEKTILAFFQEAFPFRQYLLSRAEFIAQHPQKVNANGTKNFL